MAPGTTVTTGAAISKVHGNQKVGGLAHPETIANLSFIIHFDSFNNKRKSANIIHFLVGCGCWLLVVVEVVGGGLPQDFQLLAVVR